MNIWVLMATSALMLLNASQASAYTPKWLQCDGQVVVKGGNDPGMRPAHDIYIYDDDNKNLFAWLRNSEAMEPVKLYSDNEIRWSSDVTGFNNARWEGRIDRKSLALRLDYADTESTRLWTEQCAPISPLNSSVSAAAGNITAGPGSAAASASARPSKH